MHQGQQLLEKRKKGTTMGRRNTGFRLRACLRCRGDACLDGSDFQEWRCLQCGRTVPEAPGTSFANLRGLWATKEAIVN